MKPRRSPLRAIVPALSMLALSGCHGHLFHGDDVLDHVLDLTMNPAEETTQVEDGEIAGQPS